MRKTFTPAQIIAVLNHHGFVLKRIKGSHRIFTHPEKRNFVVVPFHKKDLPKGTAHAIFKAAGLAHDEL